MSELKIEIEKTFLDKFFLTRQILNNYTYNQEMRDQTLFLRNQPNTKIADVIIQKSHTNIEYTLNSGSFLEVISYIGGIWSMLFLFLSIIVHSYNKNDFFIELGNQIFQYESKKSQTSNKILKHTQETEQKDEIIESVPQKIEKYLMKSYKLEVSFWENVKFLFLSVLCLRSKKEKIDYLFKNGEAISEQLDICSILRKLHEVEKLKKLVLSPEQLTIFNFTQKPYLDLDTKFNKFHNKDFFYPSFIFKKRESLFVPSDKQNHEIFLETNRSNKIMNIFDPYVSLVKAWEYLKTKKKNEAEKKFNERLFELIEKKIQEILEETGIKIEKKEVLDTKESEDNKKLNIVLTHLKSKKEISIIEFESQKEESFSNQC